MRPKASRRNELADLTAKIRTWQRQHNTPEKVSASHRKVLLQRVVESMAFENQPVSMERLTARLEARKKKSA
ncbi:MAG: hypothetical protein ACOYXU_13985 [Nitrospirota bacterium]